MIQYRDFGRIPAKGRPNGLLEDALVVGCNEIHFRLTSLPQSSKKLLRVGENATLRSLDDLYSPTGLIQTLFPLEAVRDGWNNSVEKMLVQGQIIILEARI